MILIKVTAVFDVVDTHKPTIMIRHAKHVSVPVTSRCSSKMAECITELVFGMGASFHLSYTAFKRNFGYAQN